MLVSKGKFAEMVQRTPAAVSQWIASGKLSGSAIVGEGRFAQIDVEVALQQIGMTLDLGQQLAQSSPILSSTTVAAALPSSAIPLAPPPSDDDQKRLLKARADREELARAQDEADAAARRGEWMVTVEAEAAWSEQIARLQQAIESWLVTTAATECATIAGGADAANPRAYAVSLRRGFEGLCARLSQEAAADLSGDDGSDDDDEDA